MEKYKKEDRSLKDCYKCFNLGSMLEENSKDGNKKYNKNLQSEDFRTDLAVERRELYKKANSMEEINGILAEEENVNEKLKITRVVINNKEGEIAIKKPIGTYVTIDMQKLNSMTEEDIQKTAEVVSSEIKKLLEKYINKKEEILVVGLGNRYVTPDSLGPKVISNIDITRHLIKYVPQYVDENTRSVSAVSPGVLGTTGIETTEILKGIVQNINPKLIIVIDALASRSIERISSTIQISDTGIVPGAGVGNTRQEISKNSLGVPVIAIGIPTVVETAILVNDCIEVFLENLKNEDKSNEYLNEIKNQDNYEKIKEALIPKNFNFIVTPKEIDQLIENMSSIIARGINMSL